MRKVLGGAALLVALTVASVMGQSRPAGRAAAAPPYTTWSSYLGGAHSSQFSALSQINKNTVGKLTVAWSYPTGDRQYLFNPIVVGNVMYVLAKSNAIVALDAATGKELWEHPNMGAVGARGINYWESADRSDRRLVFLNGGMLTAINAATGETITSFGTDGKVDLRTALDRDAANVRPLQTSNPGRVFENLVLVSLPAQGAGHESTPGDVQAYDVRTGKLAWVFHSIPRPGEPGSETWPKDAGRTAGGVHNWNEMTIDEARGIAYIPFGTARYDFYGADREGDNLYGNSLVALDARTGKKLWHFQMIHHDLWDWDLPSAPKLLTIRQNGRNVDAVAQPTKHGFVFVFDRVTGKPIWPIEERPVPQIRYTRRARVADAAVPDQAGAVRPPAVHRAGHQPLPAQGRAGRDSRAAQAVAQRGPVHAAQPPGLDPDARPQRRRQLGQLRRRPDQGRALHRVQGPADHAEADPGRSRRAAGARSRAAAG